jgi:hypothetical protein
MESFEYHGHTIWITQSFRWVYSIDGGKWSKGFWKKEDCISDAKLSLCGFIDLLY